MTDAPRPFRSRLRRRSARVGAGPQEAQGFACPGPGLARERLRALWSDFDHRYALFEVRLPDGSWDDLGRAACESLSDDTSDRAIYEGRGVPVDVEAPPDEVDVGRGKDMMLEVALETLRGQAS